MKRAPVLLLVFAATAAPARAAEERWPLWDRYAEAFVSEDGRVIERSAKDRTTSEGQAYGMFFALVANDRPRFERLLTWTRANLAGGDLHKRLPGWTWGQDDTGAWRLLDQASATDADLWLAYALLEAGCLWEDPAIAALGGSVLRNVRTRALVHLPRVGPMLLPGPVGFELRRGRLWRLNPSYHPLPLLRRFATFDRAGVWNALAANTVRMVRTVSPHGFVPDWVAFDRDRGFTWDPVSGPVGSYDAIRVYLWAGLTAREDRLRATLVEALKGPARAFAAHGQIAEKVDVRTGREQGPAAPPGFLGALLPGARAHGEDGTAVVLEDRLDALMDRDGTGLYGDPPVYYDQNLLLFARGFVEGRYRFDADGVLVPAWRGGCAER